MSRKILETRKKILETASNLLLEGHGQGVRMADIAREAGISRQAVYLHFASRAELMIATVRHLDEVNGLKERLRKFDEETTGIGLLNAFIDFWGNYIPEIYGVAKALMAARETDEAAAAAWKDRMDSIRSGCREVVEALKRDGSLTSEWDVDEAIDLFWTILSIQNWELLTIECGWPISRYVEQIQKVVKSAFVRYESGLK